MNNLNGNNRGKKCLLSTSYSLPFVQTALFFFCCCCFVQRTKSEHQALWTFNRKHRCINVTEYKSLFEIRLLAKVCTEMKVPISDNHSFKSEHWHELRLSCGCRYRRFYSIPAAPNRRSPNNREVIACLYARSTAAVTSLKHHGVGSNRTLLISLFLKSL